MNVKRALREVRAPDEAQAQARAWEVIAAAYREGAPAVRSRRRWQLALVPALIAVAAALTLTPAGATVSRLISHALGVAHPARALFSLPAPGRLLISGPGGTWTVTADGTRRHLGGSQDASWSPHGLYIAAATTDQLTAIDPHGRKQWALARPAVSDPRWYPPTGFRIAYLSGVNLRVIAGDGTGDHLLASGVAPVAPVWRPDHPYQLAYVQHRQVELRDADTHRLSWTHPAVGIRKLGWSADGSRLLVLEHHAVLVLTPAGKPLAKITTTSGSPLVDASLSPDGQELALVLAGHHAGLSLVHLSSRRPALRSVLPGTGMQQVDWSPNGRWLLVSWPAADQWVFVAVHGPPRITAVSNIARQFDNHPTAARFPRLEGWCCTTLGSPG